MTRTTNNPEILAARRLWTACRSGDATTAYAALMDWNRAVRGSERQAHLDRLLATGGADDLRQEWASLSRHVYGVEPSPMPWSGAQLAEAFARIRRPLARSDRTGRANFALPALNPAR